MPSIFDLLYREYCRARLAEMRKQLLISPEKHEVYVGKIEWVGEVIPTSSVGFETLSVTCAMAMSTQRSNMP